jgi:ammonia channel protein AmtB
VGQLGSQLLGMLVCFLWVTSVSLVTFLAIRRFVGLRVSPLEETEGFDLSGVVKTPDAQPLNEAELYALLGGDA